MKKWIIRISALSFLGIVLVTLSNLLIGILSEPLRAKYLQDKTINEMYNLIKQSNVDIRKLKFVLGNFGESSIVEQFVFSIFFSSIIILIYKGIVKLLEKIIR
jgi:hypothetical protein